MRVENLVVRVDSSDKKAILFVRKGQIRSPIKTATDIISEGIIVLRVE